MSEAEERLLLLRQLEELRLERDACTTINRVAKAAEEGESLRQ